MSFPCRHIFHLNCLLTGANPTSGEGGPPIPLETPEEDIVDMMLPIETLPSARSVGTKVTHAALLKEKLAASEGGGQCTICKQRKKEEALVAEE